MIRLGFWSDENLGLLAMGYCAGALRPGAFRLRAHFFRGVSHRAVVGAGRAWASPIRSAFRGTSTASRTISCTIPTSSRTLLNRIFSLIESLSMGFSQTFYEYVHQRHHMGNSDRPDEHGETIDWLSIYRHGHDGEAENIWSYVFLGYFRDDPKAIYQRDRPAAIAADAVWGVFEIGGISSASSSCSDFSELALHAFLPALLLFRPLPLLPQRLLPSLRRQSRQADRLGREQLSQALQLALVQQRLSCRAPFPAQDALDRRWTSFIARSPTSSAAKACG